MKPIAIAGWLALVSTASAADNPLKQVAGRYEVQSQCSVLGDNGYEPCGSEMRDSFVLTWTSDTSASFDLYSVQVNGHQCALSGVAELQGGSLVYVDPKAPGRGQGITIQLVAGEIRFAYLPSEPAHDFRYCGTRASLSRIAFPLASRVHE